MSHPVVRSPRKLTATRRDDPNVRYHYWPEERNYLTRMKTMLMHPEVFKRQEPVNRSQRAITPEKRDHKDLYFHQWPEKKNFQFKPPLNLKIEENKYKDEKPTEIENQTGQQSGAQSARELRNPNPLVPIQEEIQTSRYESTGGIQPNDQYTQNQMPQNQIQQGQMPQEQMPQNPGQDPQQYYSSQDQAEMQEYDFYNVNSHFTTMVAPFGTNHTPPMSYKIVGGHYVPVVEHLSRNDPFNGQQKIHHLDPITDKPNNIDPRILTDRSRQYYKNQNQEYGENKEENLSSHIQGKATFEARNRPDSKSFIPRERLPPINANRKKNEMSTVFENESWVKHTNPPLQSDTEYKNHYHFGDQYDRNGYDNDNHRFSDSQSKLYYPPSEDNLKDFEKYIPNFNERLLPVDPVRYPPQLEERLMGITARLLEGLPPGQGLQDIYLTITEVIDRELVGYVRLSDIEQLFSKYNVHFSEQLLRFIGAQFVSRSKPDLVNYEKLLSFMGTAIKMSGGGSNNVQNGRPQYYSQAKVPNTPTPSLKESSPFHDREIAKLINMTQTQLKENNYHIDMEALMAAFQREDRENRDTLSADQILRVVYELRIPLQRSLILSILMKCEHISQWQEDHPPNVQQYNWVRFYEFLTKVQPLHTGLPIPASKRPLDYAKTYPMPMDTWPKAKESPRLSPPMWKKENGSASPLPRKRESEALLTNRSVESHKSTRRNIMWDKIAKLDQELHDLEEQNQGYGLSSPRKRDDYYEHQPLSNRNYHQNEGGQNLHEKQVWEKIQHVDHELKQLEETNKGEQQAPPDDNDNNKQMLKDGIMEPWNQRFLKLANKLFLKDEQRKCDGTLPFREVLEVTNFCNKQYHLHIPEETIVRRARDCFTSNQNVDIASFLSKIGNMEW